MRVALVVGIFVVGATAGLVTSNFLYGLAGFLLACVAFFVAGRFASSTPEQVE